MADGKKVLGRADILGSADIKIEEVDCPEWGGVVLIRNLTAKARGVFINASIEAKEAADAAKKEGKKVDADFRVEAMLVMMAAVGEDHQPLFSSDDLGALIDKSAAPVGRCAEVAQRLSGLVPKAKEEAAKN